MSKSNWVMGAAVVLVALLIALTFDPLGFFDEPGDEAVERIEDGGRLEAPGLAGKGKRPELGPDPVEYEGDPVGILDLGLGTSTLKGTVTAEGEPLRLARVRPVLPPPHDTLAVRTRTSGQYEVRGLPAGQYDVRASASGFVSRTVVSPPVTDGATAQVEPIDLLPRQARADAIQVKVTDPFGQPIPGAKVLASTLRWDIHLAMGPELAGMRDVQHASGSTDERGKVHLGPLQPANYHVVAQAPGYVPGTVDNVVVASGRVRHLTLQLIEGVSLSGRVESAEGAPVEGAVVMGMAIPAYVTSLAVRSGADGSFVLDGLRRSSYMIFGYDAVMGEKQTSATAPGSGVKLVLGGTGTVKGKLVWKDGSPVKGGAVRPYQGSPFRYVYSQVVSVGEDGSFETRVSKGSWILRAQSADGHLAEEVSVEVVVGETRDVTIKLDRTGIVRGVVLGDDGQHVANAEIYVLKGGMPESPSREQYARSDADGAFEVPGLPLGPIFLYVQHPEWRDTKLEFTPAIAASAKEISVRLERGATVRGRVSDAGGRGIEGEQVNLIVSFFEARTTFTDGAGAYVFEAVSPSTYTVTTGPFEQGARGLSKSGVTVGESGEVVVDFETTAAAGRLSGEVQMSGAPVAGASVSVQDARGPTQALRAKTDANGRFAVEGIQFGRVRVEAIAPGGLRGDATVEVTEAEAPTEVVVTIGSASLKGRVMDESGAPITGAWSNIELVGGGDSGWRQIKANGNTDANGVFEARGLEPGLYRMRFNLPGYAQFLSATIELAKGQSGDLGDMRMRSGVQITGQVKDDAGKPLEKVTVTLIDSQGRPVFNFSIATTGSDGRYVLRGIEPDRYTVRFEVRGHAPFESPIDCSSGNGQMDGVMTRGGSVKILVEDESGHPLSGVRVRLYDAQGQLVSKTISMSNFDTGRRITGADGETALADLAGGTYTVRCERAGWAPMGPAPRAFLSAGGLAEVRVVMKQSE